MSLTWYPAFIANATAWAQTGDPLFLGRAEGLLLAICDTLRGTVSRKEYAKITAELVAVIEGR